MALRRRFRPSQIAVLLVGESPPAGDTFFYDGDSNLFCHTWKAFMMAIHASPSFTLARYSHAVAQAQARAADAANNLPIQSGRSGR